MIRISPIRVIDQHQEQLGIIPTAQALDIAREAGLDLVEVSPTEKPPVCRILDYGKHLYEKKKRQKASAGSHVVVLKEIRIRPKTDPHDRKIKLDRAHRFLEEGNKVQFTMLFRGRERFQRERSMEIFESLLAEFGDTVKIERAAKMDGRRMTMVVAPVTRQKTGAGPAKEPQAPARVAKPQAPPPAPPAQPSAQPPAQPSAQPPAQPSAQPPAQPSAQPSTQPPA